VQWLTSIQEWQPPHRFVDVQVRGPYSLWHHTHTFEADGAAGTLMCDRVRYALPWAAAGELAHRAFVRRDLRRIFDYRGREVARRLGHAWDASESPGPAHTAASPS
jgi:ligand-binding SRPBCC domain-containing protein